MKVIQIGRCIGCNTMGRLDDGVGLCCLNHPQRGRNWANKAARIRRDPQYKAMIYSGIQNEGNRKLFIEMFGNV